MTRGWQWMAWSRRQRSRFTARAAAPFGAAMTLLARRFASATILQPVSIRVGWNWRSSIAGAPARPLQAAVPRMVSRHTVRERIVIGGAPRLAMEAPRQDRGHVASQNHVAVRLHTASRLHTLLRTAALEHATRRTSEHVHVSETHRRFLTAEPLRAAAPRLREAFSRREEGGSQTAPMWTASKAERTQEAAPRRAAPETRIVERAVPAAAPPPAPINVDWIASQVMEQMDRRLVAYRERLGRI
jgi:hypothetical protein